MSETTSLSKSGYMQGHQCALALWFNRHGLHKADGEKKKPGIRAASRLVGDEVGRIARDCFGAGAEVTTPYYDIPAGIEATQKFIQAGEEVIFEATARNDANATYARIDILKKVPGTDEWDMIEVKSGTSVKDKYIEDLAFQYHVFTGAGYKIRTASIMRINNKYIADTRIDPAKLFKIADVTDKVKERQGEIDAEVEKLKAVVVSEAEPKESIGQKCSVPNPCSYRGHCWKDVPLYSVFNVFSFQGTMAEELVSRTGSYDIHDIPEDAALKGTRSIEIRAHLAKTPHSDPAKLAAFLKKIEYPLYFVDYEAVQSAIPLYKGTRPYQQIPFQFSLHVQHNPGGPVRHFEFLHTERTDPREAFARELVSLCGNKGSVIVYNADFESRRNKELAEMFPQYAAQLGEINKRMVDLYTPFKYRWLYHPDQMGSASIKHVLPAFTNMNYDGLEVGNGEQALNEYLAFVKEQKPEADLPALWEAMRVYCAQDTIAMVRLLDEAVRKYALDSPPALSQSYENLHKRP